MDGYRTKGTVTAQPKWQRAAWFEEVYGVGYDFLRRLAEKGEVRSKKLAKSHSGAILFSVADFERWFDGQPSGEWAPRKEKV